MRRFSRRRFLTVMAATTAAGLSGIARAAQPRAAQPATHYWEGEALGADATITLAGLSSREAENLFAAALAEIVRLEKLFSLYDPSSALSRLKATGTLLDPSPEFLDLMQISQRLSALSNGAFDPTIQPLWLLYAENYGDVLAPRAPTPEEVAAKRAVVGFAQVEITPSRVTLKPGMAMTLNGVAQGYITDRVTDILRAGGVAHALVNLGEHRAIGTHPEGRPWQIGIQHPGQADDIVALEDLFDNALSTSGGYGGRFGNSSLSHLINARDGKSADLYQSLSVVISVFFTHFFPSLHLIHSIFSGMQ